MSGCKPSSGVEALLRSALSGDYAAVVAELLAGVSPNCCDSMRRYPLMIAAAAGHSEICLLIVKSWNGDVSVKGKSDNTPLHVASNSDTVEVLIHAGASVNVQNVWGKTPLMAAVMRANLQTVTSFVQCGVCCTVSDKDGKTALHYAVSQSNPNMNIIQLLVEHGADLNSRTKSGCTPLFMACWFGNREAAEWLCKAGASVNEANYIGHTPLCVLLKDQPFAEGDEEQIVEFVDMLLSYGCDVNHRTDSGKSLLMLYIEGLLAESMKDSICSNISNNFTDEPEETMKITNAIIDLLENGSNINAADMNGDTALHKAAWIIDLPAKVAQTLLRKGANPNLGNNLKTTALHLAVNNGIDWIRTLVDHGADVNSKDKYESTAFHYAAWAHVSSKIADFLIVAGAQEDAVDKTGWTAGDILQTFCSEALEDDYLQLTDGTPLTKIKGDDNKEQRAFLASTADDIRPEYFALNSNSNRQEILDSLLNHPRFGFQVSNEDTIRLKQTIASFLLKLCQFLELENDALKCQPILSGSTSENTKIGLPDEFDYMLLVEKLEILCETIESDKPGFVLLRRSAQKSNVDEKNCFDECFDSEGFLNALLVQNIFVRSIGKILQQKELYEGNTDSICIISAEYPISSGAAITIQLRYTGQYMKTLQVSIDIVPVIQIKNNLSGLIHEDFPLISEDRRGSLLVTLRNTELDLTFPNKQGMRVSFSLMETSIFHNMPLNARQGYALCKVLLLPGLMPYIIYRDPSDEDFDIDECPEPIIQRAGISSYLLKNALFAELDQCSSDSSVDCLSISVYEWTTRIFVRLYKAVSDRRLSSFFMPAINLLQAPNEAKRSDNIFGKFDRLLENDEMFFRDDADNLIVTAHVDHDNDNVDDNGDDDDDDADMTESCAMKQIVLKTILCLLGKSVVE